MVDVQPITDVSKRKSQIRSSESQHTYVARSCVHLDRDYVNEKPLLQKYLKLNPSDPQGLRLAVQVAGMLKDKQFGQEALDLMRIHNPNAVELAKNFLPRVSEIRNHNHHLDRVSSPNWLSLEQPELTGILENL